MASAQSFGKIRTYRCPGCLAWCFREIYDQWAEYLKCRRCHRDLRDQSYVIDDVVVAARNQLYLGARIG